MATKLTSQDLRGMKPAVLKRAVSKLSCRHIDPKVRVKQLRAEVRDFERTYNMKTKTMLAKVCSGELRERGEIETWLVKYNLLQLHGQA